MSNPIQDIFTTSTTHIDKLMGSVLTIIDASMPATPQSKATKDLIKQAFWRYTAECSDSPDNFPLKS